MIRRGDSKKLLLSVSLYSYSPATLNFLSFFLKLLNKPNDYIQSWNRHISRVSGRLYILILCGVIIIIGVLLETPIFSSYIFVGDYWSTIGDPQILVGEP